MRSRGRELVALVAMMALAAVATPGVAMADPGQSSPPSTAGGSQGKGAKTDKFRAEYDNPVGGHYSCSGVRVVNRGAGTKDSETCTITDLASFPPGVYTLDADGRFVVPSGTFLWNSDYDGQLARSGTLTVTDNGDGTGTLTVDVYY